MTFGTNGQRIIIERKNRLRPCLVCSCGDPRGFSRIAGHQTNGGQQHGFARTGFAGDGRHATGGRDGGFSNRP